MSHLVVFALGFTHFDILGSLGVPVNHILLLNAFVISDTCAKQFHFVALSRIGY